MTLRKNLVDQLRRRSVVRRLRLLGEEWRQVVVVLSDEVVSLAAHAEPAMVQETIIPEAWLNMLLPGKRAAETCEALAHSELSLLLLHAVGWLVIIAVAQQVLEPILRDLAALGTSLD